MARTASPLTPTPCPLCGSTRGRRGATAGASANAVDRFIQARLAVEHLRPAPAADPVTLARRLHFVLLGLPPAPEQVGGLEADRSPGGYERLVDSPLASPHFGERWA